MSDALQLLDTEGPLAFLRAYGLDQVVTALDDPELWARAVARHWLAPGDPQIDPAALRFGVGRIVPEEKAEAILLSRSGMEQLEVWCFERLDAHRLKVVECHSRPMLSPLSSLIGGASLATGSLVRDYLDLSRPSLEQAKALVHAGVSAPFSAGTGETRYWVRKEGGCWAETDEVFSRWMT